MRSNGECVSGIFWEGFGWESVWFKVRNWWGLLWVVWGLSELPCGEVCVIICSLILWRGRFQIRVITCNHVQTRVYDSMIMLCNIDYEWMILFYVCKFSFNPFQLNCFVWFFYGERWWWWMDHDGYDKLFPLCSCMKLIHDNDNE